MSSRTELRQISSSGYKGGVAADPIELNTFRTVYAKRGFITRNTLLSLAIGFLLSATISVYCQQTVHVQDDDVEVTSWKKGPARISDQHFHVVLSSQNRRFRRTIHADTGEIFVLDVIYRPYKSLELEHWQVRLFEQISEAGRRFPDLLAEEQNESGKHYFTKGDFVGVLYPRTYPIVYSDKNEPLYGDGWDFYYIKRTRNVHIEDFVMTIRIGDLRMNKSRPSRVDALDLNIDFAAANER